MSPTKFCIFTATTACAMCVAAPSRADLFAVLSTIPGILRIDSATGNVTNTYAFPDYLPPPAPSTTVGLAFDGRIVYMSRRNGGINELWRLDVRNNFWYPPAFLDTFTPTGPPVPLTGLGYLRGGFGDGTLIGVSQNPPDDPPSSIFQYFVFPGFPDPVLVNINFPPGELPPNMAAQGADVDPATGDLWIAAEEVVGQSRTPRLLRTSLSGAVLQTLTPALDPPTLVRGVGFDAGAMFIAGRHLPTVSNNIYEIDRSTGAILRSFPLPGSGIVGALTGGSVIPEPGAAFLRSSVSAALQQRGLDACLSAIKSVDANRATTSRHKDALETVQLECQTSMSPGEFLAVSHAFMEPALPSDLRDIS
ncbi:MAG: hypothetical protein WD738_18085 [Pirellulales bacterium]